MVASLVTADSNPKLAEGVGGEGVGGSGVSIKTPNAVVVSMKAWLEMQMLLAGISP